jgi:hypothetical protein
LQNEKKHVESWYVVLCRTMQGPKTSARRQEKPKGEALHLSISSSILGSLHSSMGQSNWLIAKKSSWTYEAPPTN